MWKAARSSAVKTRPVKSGISSGTNSAAEQTATARHGDRMEPPAYRRKIDGRANAFSALRVSTTSGIAAIFA